MRLRPCLMSCVALTLAPHLWGQPAISSNGVVNATGYQEKLAPDTVFVIFGRGMGPAVLEAASAPNYPTSLGGTSISFTPASGGTAIAAKIIYTISGQVAGLLPSSIAPGAYAVRVTYNGQTSAPQNVTVVARSFGIATVNSSGAGPAQATIGNVNGGISLIRFTTGAVVFSGFNWILGPAHPGDTLVLWGTGGGADPANDTGGTSGDQTVAGNFFVLVGGRRITPLYAGASSGYPGLWQINFTLPADIALDCFASVQVSAGGELGNLASIAIAAPGATACSNSIYDKEVLAKFDAGGEIVFGAVALSRLRQTPSNVSQETGSGAFFRFKTPAFLIGSSGHRFGYCFVTDRTFPVGRDPAFPEGLLDAGAALPLSGPNVPPGAGFGRVSSPLGASYLYQASSPYVAGLYTLTGSGGSHVGPFNVSVNFPQSFTVTNWDSIIALDRRTPLTVNWSGSGFSEVHILVTTNARAGSTEHIVLIECDRVPASLGTYTIPPEALAHLTPGNATFTVQGRNYAEFRPPLVGGGRADYGFFFTNLGLVKTVPVQ